MCEQIKDEIRKTMGKWSSSQEILLRAGEMTQGELMAAQAVANAMIREVEAILQK